MDRAQSFAEKAAELFGISDPVRPLGKADRCVFCLAGPVLSISHGMDLELQIYGSWTPYR